MPIITPERARLMRARAQGLAGGVRDGDVAQVVGRAFAIQAQDAEAAALGLRARGARITRRDVSAAYGSALVRGWFMRGTLHAVAAHDARWLLGLLGPVFLAASRRRYAELGLDERLQEHAEDLIAEAVGADGPLTRAELTARLAALGVPPTGQAAFHLIRRTALRGRICHGPERAGEATFALLDDLVPPGGPPPPAREAAAELARRYLAAYAPASAGDFIAWSGLPAGLARQGWHALEDVAEAGIGGEVHVLPRTRLAEAEEPEREGPPDVRLLPAYDGYLVGYRTRDLSVPAAHAGRVWPGGGQIRPVVLADGLAVATWTRRERAVGVTPFGPLPPEIEAGIAEESADVARFLASGTG
ncbi:winged helix DNA-binding domain-containing protein [Planomonospora sp. ID91781]|uniref:winged helix DNA-binding domain-containing protein n=1 Tax=Planomonospora sp. ID91781 TaxID=2738135 RepID=UPI0018C3F9D6|nr:winged helix DNA-binding domain-containing protein [Planomonospora sp. ID91781]MBG0822755.1 winged helix DNA-binding domain-containing protein [Planomonospora sp. ID91781]